MSRSYKKNPILKDRHGSKALRFFKKQSNKKVRKGDNVAQHGKFKKIYNSWGIHDYIGRYSEQKFQESWEAETSKPRYLQWMHKQFKTYKEALIWWKKKYRYK